MEQDRKWGDTGKPGEEWRSHGEQQQQKPPLWRNWRDLSGITICIVLSVLCLGVCILVFVRTSELQSRIVSLEQQQRDAQLSAWRLSLEQVEPIILDRLDQILEEKLAVKLPKTREVREAPHSCLCPPAPPLPESRESRPDDRSSVTIKDK
ncbi:collagen alpha-1(XXIII) chain-like [Seriola aureovittata]|uniref:collagen alpha-1(XXIII) chain-like n=1 Tax=Seriola aureovittata TaxID=2871759 RepID=UPI0024BE4181|nr:collagen alpha-1(XXIII) chain-like [Seriola aureovittata]